MKTCKMFLLALLMALLPATTVLAQEIDGMNMDVYSSGENAPSISFHFEADDVMASEDGNYWQVGKIMVSGGEGKDKEYQILFCDGREAWVKPAFVVDKFRLINRDEVKVGQRVFYTEYAPEDWDNASIRFAPFYKGKITSIGKMHRNICTVNAIELRWDKQILFW